MTAEIGLLLTVLGALLGGTWRLSSLLTSLKSDMMNTAPRVQALELQTDRHADRLANHDMRLAVVEDRLGE